MSFEDKIQVMAVDREEWSSLKKRVQELELQEALLKAEVKGLHKTIDSYGSNVNRGLWLIGGGFIAAIVAFITQGGLNGKN